MKSSNYLKIVIRLLNYDCFLLCIDSDHHIHLQALCHVNHMRISNSFLRCNLPHIHYNFYRQNLLYTYTILQYSCKYQSFQSDYSHMVHRALLRLAILHTADNNSLYTSHNLFQSSNPKNVHKRSIYTTIKILHY